MDVGGEYEMREGVPDMKEYKSIYIRAGSFFLLRFLFKMATVLTSIFRRRCHCRRHWRRRRRLWRFSYDGWLCYRCCCLQSNFYGFDLSSMEPFCHRRRL